MSDAAPLDRAVATGAGVTAGARMEDAVTAVIAPGLFGLAPPLANAPPEGGSKSPPDSGFAGIVAAALAATRAGAEPGGQAESPMLIGLAESDPGGTETAHPGAAELALMLAGLAPLVQRHAEAGALSQETRSPDRLAEADIDLTDLPTDAPDHDALAALHALFAEWPGSPAAVAAEGVQTPVADGREGERLEALTERLVNLLGGSAPAGAGGTTSEASKWQAEVRDLVAARLQLLQSGAGQRPAVADGTVLPAQASAAAGVAAGTDQERSSDVDRLMALLVDADGEQGAAGSKGGDGMARGVARALASLAGEGSDGLPGGDVDGLDLSTLRQASAVTESEDAEGGAAMAADLPDELAGAQPVTMAGAAARAEAAQQAAARVADPALLASRFADTVQSAVIRGSSEVRLVLNPPDLGHLDITVVETEQGLRIRLEASQGATRELMERQLPALQQALEARDLRVDRLQVSQATAGTPGEATDGRTAGDPSTGGRGDGSSSQEPAWSPLAALGLTDGDRDDGADASSGTAATSAARGAIGADGRVDVLA